MDSLKIVEIAEAYEGKPGALIQAFQEIQALHNYLPPEAIRLVADKLGVPYSRAFSVATFYSAFRLIPRGRKVVKVCLGTACHIRGGGQILERFAAELGVEVGGTTGDGAYTLETVRCLGACAMAPLVHVGGNYHGNVRPEGVRALVEKERVHED